MSMPAAKTRDELETVIRRSASDKTWDVFSEDPALIRKMTRLHGPGRQISQHGFRWTIARSLVSLRSPRKPKPCAP